jgi:hypothetical protein
MATKVAELFSSYIDEAASSVVLSEKVDPSRIYFLRPSSLPFCGLRSFLERAEGVNKLRSLDFKSAYFTAVGTATHRIFQDYLKIGGKIIGDWWCPQCRNLDRFSTYHTCKSCSSPLEYRELEIRDPRGLIGHLDTLFKVDKDIWVVDYKTTSMEAVRRHHKNKHEFPYRNNVHQIRAYVVLLEYYFKIKIRGWILVYLPRDHPFKDRVVIEGEMSTKSKAKELQKLQRWIKVHRLSLRAYTEEHVQTLWKYKLCSSRKDYQTNYYDFFSICPFVDKCFNHSMDEVMAQKLKLGLKNKVYPLINHAPATIRKELKL